MEGKVCKTGRERRRVSRPIDALHLDEVSFGQADPWLEGQDCQRDQHILRTFFLLSTLAEAWRKREKLRHQRYENSRNLERLVIERPKV